MLESAEIGHTVAKASYARAEPRLREALLNAQFDLSRSARGPLLVLLSGVEGAGRSETANKLTEWMDPRHIRVLAFSERTAEESLRPTAWRYWQALPPQGQLGIFMNGWYTESIDRAGRDGIDSGKLRAQIEAIREHEQMLADEGVVLLKFWIRLSKDAQEKRLSELDDNPRKTWRVTKRDWKAFRRYSAAHVYWEHLLRETSSGDAPWIVVEGADERYRNLTVGKLLLSSLQSAAARGKPPLKHAVVPVPPSALDNVKLIRDLDLRQRLPEKSYDDQLEHFQGRLAELSHGKRFKRHASLVLVFEGSDAAGKGGAIRRVTGALDARQYVTVPIAAPSDEEKAHPYLWRFWRDVPPRGGIAIFDRSWYGRVLVERVEGYCSASDWQRAYGEINQFEQQLADNGAVIVKFWLQISKEEQLRRFRARARTSFKRFKITPDDWRNRKHWSAYEAAVCDMVARTSTEVAPWTLVEADDKRFARIKVLRTIVERLEHAVAR